MAAGRARRRRGKALVPLRLNARRHGGSGRPGVDPAVELRPSDALLSAYGLFVNGAYALIFFAMATDKRLWLTPQQEARAIESAVSADPPVAVVETDSEAAGGWSDGSSWSLSRWPFRLRIAGRLQHSVRLHRAQACGDGGHFGHRTRAAWIWFATSSAFSRSTRKSRPTGTPTGPIRSMSGRFSFSTSGLC